MELLDIIARAFLSPGDEAIISTPTFLAYRSFIQVNGATAVDIPLTPDDYCIDVESILLQVNSKTKLLFISSPNNPVGSIVRTAEMDLLLMKLPGHVIVVYDEVYHHYVNADDYARAQNYIAQGYPVIGLHSFSKAYGLAGIRLGYAFTTAAIAQYLRQLTRPFMINSCSMAAGIAALQDIDHINKTRILIEAQKEWLVGHLENLGITVSLGHANFIFFTPPSPFDATSLCNAMLKEGVMIRNGDVFGAPGGVRVTIGNREANKAFIKGLTNLMSAF